MDAAETDNLIYTTEVARGEYNHVVTIEATVEGLETGEFIIPWDFIIKSHRELFVNQESSQNSE